MTGVARFPHRLSMTFDLLAAMVVAAVIAMFLLVAPTGADAQQRAVSGVYPPGSSVVVTTDRQVYLPGDTVTITATACSVGDLVTFTITPPGGGAAVVLTATAVANGTGSIATVSYVAASTGTYQVTASCGGNTATTSFIVRANTPIPSTGSDVSGLALVAAIVVAVGLGLFFVARFRRTPRS